MKAHLVALFKNVSAHAKERDGVFKINRLVYVEAIVDLQLRLARPDGLAELGVCATEDERRFDANRQAEELTLRLGVVLLDEIDAIRDGRVAKALLRARSAKVSSALLSTAHGQREDSRECYSPSARYTCHP